MLRNKILFFIGLLLLTVIPTQAAIAYHYQNDTVWIYNSINDANYFQIQRIALEKSNTIYNETLNITAYINYTLDCSDIKFGYQKFLGNNNITSIDYYLINGTEQSFNPCGKNLVKDKSYIVKASAHKTNEWNFAILLKLQVAGLIIPELSWWNTSYYKTSLLINNTGNPSVLTNYQVLLNLTYNSTTMDANFTSLHLVNETSGQEQIGRFWIDRSNSLNGSYANIWLNLSSIPASVWDNTTYSLYSRNVAEVDGSNGTNTFVFFDDFSGDLSKWTVTQVEFENVKIVSGEARITGDNTWNLNGIASVSAFTRPIVIEWLSRTSTLSMYTDEGYSQGLSNVVGVSFVRNTGGSLLERRKDAAYLNIGGWTAAQAKYKIILKSGAGYTIFLNNTQKEDDTTWATNNLNVVFQTYTLTAYSYIDNVLVRKYTSPEPTVQLGVTQVQPPLPSTRTQFYSYTIG